MPRVRVTSTTGYMDEIEGLKRLPSGTVLEVPDDTAKRWARHKIAEATDLPVGHVSDAEAGMSPADIDAEIARLQSLRNRGQAPRDGALDDQAPAGLPADRDEHPLAAYDLTEEQRVNLGREGFTRPDLIDAASDDELLAVRGIGEGTLKRLRGGR